MWEQCTLIIIAELHSIEQPVKKEEKKLSLIKIKKTSKNRIIKYKSFDK